MTRWSESLPAELVLSQAEVGVIVADRAGNVVFSNEHVARLLRLDFAAAPLVGKPLSGLGLLPDSEPGRFDEITRQVLNGSSWEDTFAGHRSDGSFLFVRELAVPLRDPSGAIEGIVLVITEAGRRDTQREPDRLRLLERIGQRLAGSLELDATLRQVAQILVPRFGDHCFIDLFSGDKLIRRAAAHAGGWEPQAGTWARVGEAIQYPPGHFTQQAMSRLETIVVPDTQAGYYPAPSEQSMSAADQVGITSVLASPLYARGELLGAISLALSRITDRPDPHYDISDGDLIGAIASRVAVAIDNAMLFEAERRTPLAVGRVGLVIGDVEGRGARAAATMGQLRAALRAYAQDEKSPADIMRKLDEWVRSTAPVGAGGDPPTVSCIYLIYDAWNRNLTFANAGHAAPLMTLDGKVKPLEVRHKGVLLGVRGRGISGLPTYREQTVTLPPGAALVLYTDGLTDRRTRADGNGHYTEAEAVDMLRAALLAAPASADALAVAAENAVPGDIDDDMAILVFRSSPNDLASCERSFPAEPIMVSEARRVATATFAAWGMHPDQADLALLLVSEVVTNAVLHASVTPSPAGRRFDLELDPLAETSAQTMNVGALTPGSGFPVAAHYAPVYR